MRSAFFFLTLLAALPLAAGCHPQPPPDQTFAVIHVPAPDAGPAPRDADAADDSSSYPRAAYWVPFWPTHAAKTDGN